MLSWFTVHSSKIVCGLRTILNFGLHWFWLTNLQTFPLWLCWLPSLLSSLIGCAEMHASISEYSILIGWPGWSLECRCFSFCTVGNMLLRFSDWINFWFATIRGAGRFMWLATHQVNWSCYNIMVKFIRHQTHYNIRHGREGLLHICTLVLFLLLNFCVQLGLVLAK